VALASAGRHAEARREWDAYQRAFEDIRAAGLAYNDQHYPAILQSEGKAEEAARFWGGLAQRIQSPSVICAWFGSGSRDALYAGDLRLAHEYAEQIRSLELAEPFADIRTEALAYVNAVDRALAGDREETMRQLELGHQFDRPEESLDSAGYLQVVTAIVEHLLGDEAAACAAADAAKAAFDAKGAVALRDQVKAWVGNADKLRDAATGAR